jgi:hypothetical protein
MSNEAGSGGTERNDAATCHQIGTPAAHGDSRSVRYELIDKDGIWVGTYPQAYQAANVAKRLWPDQEQDPDRTGKGWDVQVAGVE